MEDNLHFSKMKDDLNFFKNGRQPQFFHKWKTTSTFSKKEDDPHSKMEAYAPIVSKTKFISGLAQLSKIF